MQMKLIINSNYLAKPIKKGTMILHLLPKKKYNVNVFVFCGRWRGNFQAALLILTNPPRDCPLPYLSHSDSVQNFFYGVRQISISLPLIQFSYQINNKYGYQFGIWIDLIFFNGLYIAFTVHSFAAVSCCFQNRQSDISWETSKKWVYILYL